MTATKIPTLVADVEAQRKQLDDLRLQDDDRLERDVATKRARREKIRQRLLRGQKIGDEDRETAIDIQVKDLLPAAEQAVIHAKHADDVRALVSLGDKLLEPIGRLRKAADAFAAALVEVRPLLRQFHTDAHTLGLTVPPNFVTGAFIEWELAATLYRAWPQVFSRPRAVQLHRSNVGELIERSVATAIETALRGATTTEETLTP